jgi:hypothetical protein
MPKHYPSLAPEVARKDGNAIISMPQIAHANPSLSSNSRVFPVALALFMW